jgi:Asp-tRNA(Asn)/Glu-tRNA(Gln) amidotransferase A subunit family amidase
MGEWVAVLPPWTALRRRFLSGEQTPRELLEVCLARIAVAEPTIRAFVHLDPDAARAAADAATRRYREGRPCSPIDGLPVAVKDIIDTHDMPTQMNSPLFLGHRPRTDAACVRAVRDGGGVLLGKTVTTEFAIGASGSTTNPWNPHHTPGGSSSGTAAGAAAGMFPVGFATQTQGSTIRPASYCGVVGYKPTLGALSLGGVHPLSRSHDHLGFIGQSVDTVWQLARWVGEWAPGEDSNGLSGPIGVAPEVLRPARVAVLRTAGVDAMDAASAAAFEALLGRLRETGVTLTEPADDRLLADLVSRLDGLDAQSLRMVAFDMRHPYREYLRAAPEQLGARVHELMQLAEDTPRAAYALLRAEREGLRARVAELSRHHDALILPAASGPAPAGFAWTGPRTLLVYMTYLGLPTFSLPLMQVAGLPLGVQLCGFAGDDYALARHARWLEHALGSAHNTDHNPA